MSVSNEKRPNVLKPSQFAGCQQSGSYPETGLWSLGVGFQIVAISRVAHPFAFFAKSGKVSSAANQKKLQALRERPHRTEKQRNKVISNRSFPASLGHNCAKACVLRREHSRMQKQL